jgi:hypothetical protein
MSDERGEMRAVVGKNQPLSRRIDVTEVAQLDSDCRHGDNNRR